jgi:pimeloyl-ACP methyl ester carboxylesterase
LRLLSQGKTIPAIKTKVDTFTKVPSRKDAEDFWKMVGEPKIYPPFDKLPSKFQEARLWAMRQPKVLNADNGEYWAEGFSELYADSLYSLGNKPIYVLSGAKDSFSDGQDSLMQTLGLEKLRQKEKMSKLSSNSKHIISTRSGHEVHLDEPELVITAIKAVINSVRTGKKLNR